MGDDTILETKRLRLRYLREGDIPFVVGLWMDPEMTEFTGGPRREEFLRGEFARVAADPRAEAYDLWIVEDAVTKELIGQAGFIPKQVEGREYIELNYYIDKKYWGQGYATEIARALVEYGFAVKGLMEVIAIIDPGNSASRVVAGKCSMSEFKIEIRNNKKKLIYKINK